MRRSLNLVFVTVAVLACVPRVTQSVDFTRERLSPKGRAAYQKLFSACIFRVGGVGYAGDTSQEELALYDLLEESESVDALKSLVSDGSYEGGLYGLLGLSTRKDLTEFNRAVQLYKARNELREWQRSGSFECFAASADSVTTQSGCIIMTESREKVVTDIQSGRYDKLLTGKYRSLH